MNSNANAKPTVVTSLKVACPTSGKVLVSGAGESTAISTSAGAAFIGLAYSIARDSAATDNANVIQSSALATYNGDTNSDILNIQRVDTCTPGQNYTYDLTVYRTTPDTSRASFVANGRLTASTPYSSPGAGLALGSTLIGSTSNAAPTVISTLRVTCPASGAVLVTGAGESTAVSTSPSTAFIGLAYSIARDSFATDNGNVVQSSALAVFNGDANRDFLNVQRVDSCTPGATYTYRLTAYRTTPDTGPGSFVWNGSLVTIEPISSPAAGYTPGTTNVASADGTTPTIISTLPVTCPGTGLVWVTGSGESAAVSDADTNDFIGLTYSIARDGTATDTSNAVKSFAASQFNGDANRDYLNIQRADTCTPGLTYTYRLTAYRTTAITGTNSFVWNGRLAAAPVAPAPSAPISCAGFGATKVLDAEFPVNGGATKRYYTYNNIFSTGGAGWGARDAIVLRFTAPAAGDAYMSVAVAAAGGMITRTMNLSTNACEFTRTDSSVYYLESGEFSLGFSSGPSPYVRYVLNPGQTYYLNMASLESGSPSCPDATCDAVILIQNPNP